MEITKKRYAVKLFDGKKIEQSKVDELLEMIRMSASSFGLQPYKVMVITDPKIKEQLEPVSWGQKQVTTCSHLLVFLADLEVAKRIEDYEEMLIKAGTPKDNAKAYTDMMRSFESGMDLEAKNLWAQKQIYIALGNALNGAQALGFGSCPMEGFDREEYSKILELPDHLKPAVVCPLGFPADTPKPKIRFPKEEIFI